jgi:hypothetical protein
MTDDNNDKKTLKEGEIAVDAKQFQEVMERLSSLEGEVETQKGKNAGLEAMISDAATQGSEKLRERPNFEPSFRTVTLKKYPMKGDSDKLGIVIGWTPKGAYQKVDRTGVSPQVVDWIDVIFLDHERDEKGTLQAESVPLLSLLAAPEVVCKVLETKDYKGRPFVPTYPPTGQAEQKIKTGEDISVSVWDPKHGLIQSGEKIDGWVGVTKLTYVIQVPGYSEPIEIDDRYLNM